MNMNITSGYAPLNVQSNYSNQLVTNSVCFQANTAPKLLKKVNETKDIKKLKITFDEMVKMYEYLGYDVLLKRGSHATVSSGNVNFTLPIPHKDKVVHFKDIKRLKLIAAGDIEKAKKV